MRVKISDKNFEWRFDDSFIIFKFVKIKKSGSYEFENDERIIETSFKIFITDFYSQMFVQNLRY